MRNTAGILTLLVIGLLGNTVRAATSGSYVAFSLGRARAILMGGDGGISDVSNLGSITTIVGMVHDQTNDDLILVGRVDPGSPPITIDHVVVALRAVLVRDEYPLVSIDRTDTTSTTGEGKVRFRGALEDTAYGRDLLSADVALKRLALGRLPSRPWGVESYFDRLRVALTSGGDLGTSRSLASQFWFYPQDPAMAVRDGVFVIRHLSIAIRTQVIAAASSGAWTADPQSHDPLGDLFAQDVTNAYQDLSVAYPEIGRVKTLLDLVAIARGIQDLPKMPDLHFWLSEYVPQRVVTPRGVAIETRSERFDEGSDGAGLHFMLDGGVELNPTLIRLNAGDVSALRDAVLAARPSPGALLWKLPIDGWALPGDPAGVVVPAVAAAGAPGFSLGRSIGAPGAAPERLPSMLPDLSLGSASVRLPNIATMPGLAVSSIIDRPSGLRLRPSGPEPRESVLQRPFDPGLMAGGRPGGVLLNETARSDGSPAMVEAGGGDFSLVVDGHAGRLSADAFCRFVTALWAVYPSHQDPGISLDPIGPGIDKHLVRYIGKVLNSDLGRIMREADYLMKKWAVGTERPDVPGFQSVDALWANRGAPTFGSRRFWFVPQDVVFAVDGDALTFRSARMTLRTEFMSGGGRGISPPGDQAFADFFTQHYDEIAAHYGTFAELADYARLVSLAKYLKDQDIPLLWFLLANHHKILTEDATGTVDALVKGSSFFKDLTIEGGVDLRGGYCVDVSTLPADHLAVDSRIPAVVSDSGPAETPSIGATANSRVAHKRDVPMSIVPSRVLTFGSDDRGNRYHTDLALRVDGHPSLEVVRYFDPSRPDGGEFGRGWHLMVPFRTRPHGSGRRGFHNVTIPETMDVFDPLAGTCETLDFDTERYAIAGFVPHQAEASTLLGLFLQSDGSFRLVDRIGNEFEMDARGAPVTMALSEDYVVHYSYLDCLPAEGSPLSLAPATGERVSVADLSLPARLRLVDRTNGQDRIFVIASGDRVGYVPEEATGSRYSFLACMTDGSFRLADLNGNDLCFDAAGLHQSTIFGDEEPLVKRISQDGYTVAFEYAIDSTAEPRIEKATLRQDASNAVLWESDYRYGDGGRLFDVLYAAAGDASADLQRSGEFVR